MGDALVGLGGAFLAAGLFARLGRRVGLPTIPFFMAAGIMFGPNTPGIVLVEEPAGLELIAAIGLIMLLFHLGLEFSVDDLIGGGRRLLIAGTTYLILNVGGGLLLGLAFDWGGQEALVIAGAVGISSSAIVTKLLVDLRRFANAEAPVILGIIVVEDLFLALYLALLQPIFGGAEAGWPTVLAIGRSFVFLMVLFVIARRGVALVSRLLATRDDELLTLMFVGVAVLLAGIARELGVSDAIGALMAGLIVSGTRVAERIGHLVLPLRDAFAAVFFFAFGLNIAPAEVAPLLGFVAAAAALTLVLNVAAGFAAARIYKLGRRAAAGIGFTILGRGEFSLILASLAAAAGLDERISPFVAAYVLVLAVMGPVLAARSDSIARFIPAGWFPPPNPRLRPD